MKPFNHAIDLWIAELGHYSLAQLHARSIDSDWSLGQVYMHLLSETEWYVEQMEICLTSDSGASGQMVDKAKVMFVNNEFAGERIKGDPLAAKNIPQPVSIVSLRTELGVLRSKLTRLTLEIAKSDAVGKTRHPGLGYFSALEWLQFSDMHMRHHLRQKQRIDASFL